MASSSSTVPAPPSSSLDKTSLSLPPKDTRPQSKPLNCLPTVSLAHGCSSPLVNSRSASPPLFELQILAEQRVASILGCYQAKRQRIRRSAVLLRPPSHKAHHSVLPLQITSSNEKFVLTHICACAGAHDQWPVTHGHLRSGFRTAIAHSRRSQ